jgi:hypothetical protein
MTPVADQVELRLLMTVAPTALARARMLRSAIDMLRAGEQCVDVRRRLVAVYGISYRTAYRVIDAARDMAGTR